MLRKSDLIRELKGEPLALWSEWLQEFLARPAVDLRSLDDVEAAIHPSRQRAIARQQGAVAVLPVNGVITPKPSIWERYGLGISAQTIGATLRQLMNDDQVKAIVLDVDSPGGLSGGLTELAAEMRAMRGGKPIVAHADYLAASAAYWIASQADEVIASPSAMVGSVGVYILHVDWSKLLEAEGIKPTFIHAGEDKVLGNPFEPLNEEATAYLQGLVDDTYRMFLSDVAAGRGVDVATVRKNYGDGRVLTATEALKAGVVDKVRTLAETLEAFGVSGAQGTAPRARMSRECDLLADPLCQSEEVTI